MSSTHPSKARNRFNKIVYQAFQTDLEAAHRERVWKGIAAEMDREKDAKAGKDAIPFVFSLAISLLAVVGGIWVYIFRLHHPIVLVGIGLYLLSAASSAHCIHHVYKNKL